jgi:DNA-binding MarR family transcriptional regulator
MAAERTRQEAAEQGGRTLLEDLSLDLTHIAVMLAQIAESDARRREAPPPPPGPDAREVRAVIAARHARSAVFDLDLSNPGWSLLLELFHARLEGRAEGMARLATDARLAMATAARWIDLLCARGLATRTRDPGRKRGARIALTEAGADAMADYFTAAAIGQQP